MIPPHPYLPVSLPVHNSTRHWSSVTHTPFYWSVTGVVFQHHVNTPTPRPYLNSRIPSRSVCSQTRKYDANKHARTHLFPVARQILHKDSAAHPLRLLVRRCRRIVVGAAPIAAFALRLRRRSRVTIGGAVAAAFAATIGVGTAPTAAVLLRGVGAAALRRRDAVRHRVGRRLRRQRRVAVDRWRCRSRRTADERRPRAKTGWLRLLLRNTILPKKTRRVKPNRHHETERETIRLGVSQIEL